MIERQNLGDAEQALLLSNTPWGSEEDLVKTKKTRMLSQTDFLMSLVSSVLCGSKSLPWLAARSYEQWAEASDVARTSYSAATVTKKVKQMDKDIEA
eukprot:m.253333 g.253333  ORF g.253333 m.253333 type:complete len:97 (-) comp26717_c0_seq7:786-1076(-)